MKETTADFAGTLASHDMTVKRFFPPVEVGNRMTDQNVNHKTYPHSIRRLQDTKSVEECEPPNELCSVTPALGRFHKKSVNRRPRRITQGRMSGTVYC